LIRRESLESEADVHWGEFTGPAKPTDLHPTISGATQEVKHPPTDLRLNLYANWPNRRQNLGAFIDQAKGFLLEARRLHPLFGAGLHFVGVSRGQSPALEEDLSNLESVVLAKGWDREATRSLFSNLSRAGEVTRESMSELGFRFSVGNLDRLDRGNVNFGFSEGSASSTRISGLGIGFPLTAGSEFVDLAFLKQVLGLVVSYWEARFAGVGNLALSRAVRVQKGEPFALPIGWLNYCDDPRVAEALPTDITSEHFGPGGVLFRLQDAAPVDDVEVAIQTALRVRDALLPGQWMSHEEDRTVGRP
jgi:hypothetical protein